MEVVVAEEKKKIFRARKTMKISDRQQLESLHSTLITATPGLSETSSPPLLNGMHKEDGPKAGDKEQNNVSDSNSPRTASPSSPTLSSPAPFLSLNLSPSPASSQSPPAKDAPTSPTSPFHSLNFELKKMEQDGDDEDEKKGSSSSSSKESVPTASTESKENQDKDNEVIKEKEKVTATDNPAVDLAKDCDKGLDSSVSEPPPSSDCTEPMDTDSDTTKAKDSETSKAKIKDVRLLSWPSSKNSTTSDSSPPCPSSSHPASSSKVELKQEKDIKNEKINVEEVKKERKEKGSASEEKMEVKVETKKKKTETTKPSRPSSTPPSNTVQEEKGSTSGLKRTLSEGDENDGQAVKREGKRPKVEREELEAQLELKITANAAGHHKLEQIVQQLVDERLRVLEMTIFDKHFEELKTRVDKIDCATKHQTAINTLQAKIARLAKKFGEANQASENKRKNEALAAAAAANAANAAKTTTVSTNPQAQRPLRAPMEVKQAQTVPSSSTTASLAQPVPTAASVQTPTSTAMVTQAPILQLITSTSNAASSLAAGITTQSPTGTLLLKTASGSSMMTTGQPLLIQLPLSMANGQAGTLVNIPVSSLTAANSLTKAKTTSSTATFILKPASAITTAAVSASTVATVPALQAGQMSPTQISLARAVYQGGAGGIMTPNAGVSVTTARTSSQSVSVAGAMSSASSPATSGPAATGSTAPGPPQGTSLTSKTEALAEILEMNEGESDGGEMSDVDWSEAEERSDSDPEPPRPKKNKTFVPTAPSVGVSTPVPGTCEEGKDGTIWETIQPGGHSGRQQSQNVLTESAGPTAHAMRNIEDALSALLCLLDMQMLQHIRDCTVAEARRIEADSSWDLSVAELKAFIALLYVRGAFNKNIELESFWSEEWGLAFFRTTMPRNRFRQIMRYLCFDKKDDRHARLCSDKFALMSEVWGGFVSNSIACYKPGACITVDEQLFPTKARCRFTQYMANKPDKFGIKFWLAADVETRYFLNGFPYLGKDDTRPAHQRLGESVVMKLVEPYVGKRRNVTTGKFFTSLTLAKNLQRKNTSLVGTVNKARRELPSLVQEQRGELFATKVLKHERATLTVYQEKPRKSVALLSTMHPTVSIGSDRKRKPETVTFYNVTKVGVHVLDRMARRYTVKGRTRRWPVAVFYNLLDMAAINAHVLFKACTSTTIPRRAFILELAKQLREEHLCVKASFVLVPMEPQHPQEPKRRQCQINTHCKKNKTGVSCKGCKRPVCGKCTVRVEHYCPWCVC
ncbi:activating transcription factor 7-interacting protein 1 isoform X2 [Labrus bergylta]|uniref:activating transcription factor 7-interacting protein 1 isoform X2 n=1 Tax=Labrus bergylta TaxID=56723 RepID=UPI0033131F42